MLGEKGKLLLYVKNTFKRSYKKKRRIFKEITRWQSVSERYWDGAYFTSMTLLGDERYKVIDDITLSRELKKIKDGWVIDALVAMVVAAAITIVATSIATILNTQPSWIF
jgi:hypothetical protein